MKSNEFLLREFEARRNFTSEEFQAYINEQRLNENDDNQIIVVDDIFDYMASLGYSTLDKIKEAYHL